MQLSDTQFEQYQRDGYVVVEECLDSAVVRRVTERIDAYVRGEREGSQFERMLEPDAAADALGDADPVRKFEGLGMVREDDVFADLVTDEIRQIGGITDTETLIGFRVHSSHDLENMFSIGMD